MQDYARIIGKITNSVWLMESSALAQLMDIVEQRVVNGKLSEDELSARLSDIGLRSNGDGEPVANNGIGVLSLYGPIFGKANLMTQLSGATSLEMFQSDLNEMLENDRIHTIIMNIDSPGGTSDGVAETGQMIREGREIKPIYAVADSMAGSAAYWLASQATEVYATPSGSVGSVGAYTVHEDRSVADAQSGHKYTFISAGPYKVEGNPHEPLSQEGEAYRQEVINELYDDFVIAIAEGRSTDKETVIANYGKGRMLTAKKALDAGMIDGITTQDALIRSINRPTGVIQIPVASVQSFAPYMYTSNNTAGSSSNIKLEGVTLKLDGAELAEYVRKQLEHKDMEHSEPGSGIPPLPRTDDDGNPDPAIEGGWRRDTPPPEGFDNDNETHAMEGGVMEFTDEQIAQLSRMYDVDDADELCERIKVDHSEALALKNAVTGASEETRLADEYPETWARIQRLETRDREHEASAFVDSVKSYKVPDGDNFKASGKELSALTMDEIRAAHIKFAQGVGNLEDFENVVKLIMNGGIVQMQETGSSIPAEVPLDDTASAEGVAYVRKAFADKIAAVRAENPDMPYQQALKQAAIDNPELAAAYRAAVPR